jgi:hypothetical protein
MTLCEWRICHSASASSQRSNMPRVDDSTEFEPQGIVFMWAFPTLSKPPPPDPANFALH